MYFQDRERSVPKLRIMRKELHKVKVADSARVYTGT